MKVECIVSTLVVVDVPDGYESDAVVEALAKNDFFGHVADRDPDKLHVEILEPAE